MSLPSGLHSSQDGSGIVVGRHGWTPHSQSVNLRDVPRLALVARWNDKRPLLDENGDKTFHVPPSDERLFEHWSGNVAQEEGARFQVEGWSANVAPAEASGGSAKL